jgi:hypothetical protein
MLVKKSWTFIVRRPDGTYFGTGMGQDGAYAAVLVIRSIWEESN